MLSACIVLAAELSGALYSAQKQNASLPASWVVELYGRNLVPPRLIPPAPHTSKGRVLSLSRCVGKSKHNHASQIKMVAQYFGDPGDEKLGRLEKTLEMLQEAHLWDASYLRSFCNVQIWEGDLPRCASTDLAYSFKPNDSECNTLPIPSQIMASARAKEEELAYSRDILDPKFGGDYEIACEAMRNASRLAPNSSKVGWAGKCGHHQNSQRHQLAEIGKRFPNQMDIRCNHHNLTLFDMVLKWKYFVDVEGTGTGYSGRLPMLLRSGRLVFYVDRKQEQWFMAFFEAWEHYVPVRSDLSDFIKNLNWVNSNPDEARRMTLAGVERANAVLTRDAAIHFTNGLFNGRCLWAILQENYREEYGLQTPTEP